MMSGDLEQMLAALREISDRRAAAEPGTEERAELDGELLTVQDRIRHWSEDEPDEEPSG